MHHSQFLGSVYVLLVMVLVVLVDVEHAKVEERKVMPRIDCQCFLVMCLCIGQVFQSQINRAQIEMCIGIVGIVLDGILEGLLHFFHVIQLQQQVSLVNACLHHVHLQGQGSVVELQGLARTLGVQFDEIGQVVKDIYVHGGNAEGFGLRDKFNILQVCLEKEKWVIYM